MNIKKSPKFILGALAIGLLFLLILIFYVGMNQKSPSPKNVIKMQVTWAYPDLDTALQEAAFIVYGKVVKISDTKLHKVPTSSGKFFREYYKDITIEVITQAKGTASNATVNFREIGGETKHAIYLLPGYEPLRVDEEVVLFANQHGAFLSPDTLIRVQDGMVTPSSEMSIDPGAEDASGSVEISNYMENLSERLRANSYNISTQH